MDDDSRILTFRDGKSIQEVSQEAQKVLSLWQKLLQLTGSDLALEKCVFSVMKWTRKKGKEVIGNIKEILGHIHIDSKLKKI